MPTEKIAELMKKPLVATGTVELVAAKDAEGKPDANGNKRMSIATYNGGLMNVGWGLPVGIELAGLKWRDDNAIPIMCLHNTNNIDAICGQATKISHDGKTLTIDADFMPVSDDAKKVHELAKAGFKFQASVGVSAQDVLVSIHARLATGDRSRKARPHRPMCFNSRPSATGATKNPCRGRTGRGA